MIEFNCPQCNKHLRVDDSAAGKRGKCPKCGSTVEVPLPNSGPTSTPPEDEISVAAYAPEQVPARRTADAPLPPPLEAGHAPQAPSVNVNLPKRASSLGIVALILGIIAFLMSWIPLVGVLSIPLAVLGLIFGIVGFIISITRNGSGIGYPLAGGIVSGLALLIGIGQVVLIGSATNAAATAIQQANQQMARTNQRAVAPLTQSVSGGGTSNLKDPANASPSAKPKETPGHKPSLPHWASARQPVRQGDLQVSIKQARVGKIPVKDMFGQAKQSIDDLFSITLELKNLSKTQKIQYESWSGADFTLSRDFATMADNFGNNYKRINFGATAKIVGQTESDSIYPGSSLHDVLVFERPIDSVKYLDLELPASNFGGTGMLRLRIPSDMIQK